MPQDLAPRCDTNVHSFALPSVTSVKTQKTFIQPAEIRSTQDVNNASCLLRLVPCIQHYYADTDW
jgi:hypothetical protein